MQDVVALATNKNTQVARLNAESWAQAAMAMYLQQTFNLNSPPVLKEYAATNDSVVATINGDDFTEGYLEQMPDWFVPPIAQDAPEFNPNMASVVQLSSVQ